MDKHAARQNLIAVLGKITAFYESPLPPLSASRKGGKDSFTTREEWEKRLARKLRGKFAGQLKELLALLGDPPRLENVPADFWEMYGAELRRIVEDTLMDIALERADDYLRVAPIGGVDWMQVNEYASSWARQYTYDLVKEITDSQREKLREEISRFYQDGNLTIDDISRALEAQFSASRAEMIAVTEVTRAAVEGERGIVREIENYGIRMQAVWRTANDDVVCEVCGPRDGKPVDGEDYPPAHPNCRCGVTWEIVENE